MRTRRLEVVYMMPVDDCEVLAWLKSKRSFDSFVKFEVEPIDYFIHVFSFLYFLFAKKND